MTERDPDEVARRLATAALAGQDPTGWFERLYAAAAQGEATVPWDRADPSPLLVEWADRRELAGAGRRAVVVGCGLGRDAEHVATLGFDTVAFDISETAIRTARERHPGSLVRYEAADLFAPPRGWLSRFDLVVESITVQSLPPDVRGPAITNVSGLLAPGGTLIVIALAHRDGAPAVSGPPWPLTRAEVDAFGYDDTRAVAVELVPDPVDPSVSRWRAEFHRAG